MVAGLAARKPEARPAGAPPHEKDLFVSRALLTTHAVGLGIFGVAFSFALHLLNPPAPPDDCDVSAEGSCPPGMECNAGVCIKAEDARPFCEFGKSCEGCNCTGSCDSGVCIEPRVGLTACDDPGTQRLIQDLVAKHGQCKEKVGASFTGCQAPDVREFLINHPEFKRIEQTFPDVTLLTFPSGKPANVLPASETRGQRGGWPDAKTRAFYVSRLREAIPAFKQAQYILIFGRASSSGNMHADFSFAQARVAWARSLILEEAAGKDLDARSKINAKILEFSLGAESGLRSPEFAKMSKLRVATHRSEELRSLLAAADRERNGTLSAGEREEIEERINRSVTIVVINCAPPGAADNGAP